MKVLIFAGCYYPHVHPRAFRATELAKEFRRQGDNVKVVNMTTIEQFDYSQYSKTTGIIVENLDINCVSNTKAEKPGRRSSFIGRHFKKLIDFFFHGRFFVQSHQIISKLQIDRDVDLVIALSTPFVCLYTVSKYIKREGKSFVAIADRGDPFYYSKQSKYAIWFKWIEKKVYEKFDYLTIPTENAIPLYSPLIDESKIRIIPQGFNMDNLNLYEGELSAPVSFAYAGVFYWDIRNPEFLFSYLDKLNMPFRFYLFMRYNDPTLDVLIRKYKNLEDKVIKKYSLPHDELLYELSKMHFLINIENISNTQMPSKLIDYGMSGRPTVSFNKETFKPQVLNEFLNGEYRNALEIDLKKYDIKTIVAQFKILVDEAS